MHTRNTIHLINFNIQCYILWFQLLWRKKKEITQIKIKRVKLYKDSPLTHETFLFLFCLIMATSAGRWGCERSPGPQQIPAQQPFSWACLSRFKGWWPGGKLSSAMGHFLSCTPTRQPCPRLLNTASDKSPVPLHGLIRKFTDFFRLLDEAKSQNWVKMFCISFWCQRYVTWWTGYEFKLTIMKHPFSFNPALLSHSMCPIAEQIAVASSRGWAYRSIRMKTVTLWRREQSSPLSSTQDRYQWVHKQATKKNQIGVYCSFLFHSLPSSIFCSYSPRGAFCHLTTICCHGALLLRDKYRDRY